MFSTDIKREHWSEAKFVECNVVVNVFRVQKESIAMVTLFLILKMQNSKQTKKQLCALTHFKSMFPFHIPCKQHKTKVLLISLESHQRKLHEAAPS